MPPRWMRALLLWWKPALVGATLASGAWVALGFGIPLTPRAQLAALHAQVAEEAVTRARVDVEILDSIAVVRHDHVFEILVLRGLGTLACLDPRVQRDRTLVRLPCRELLDPTTEVKR